MIAKLLPSIDTLRQLLRYDAHSGELIWLERGIDLFKNQRSCSTWNANYAGKVAGHFHPNGYIYLGIFGKLYSAHRVAFYMHHGSISEKEIDHINGIKSDNSIVNLRQVSRITNMRNTKKSLSNTSGMTGVYWDKCIGKWTSKIGVNGRSVHLGCFEKIENAIAARKSAEQKYEFHNGHGRRV